MSLLKFVDVCIMKVFHLLFLILIGVRSVCSDPITVFKTKKDLHKNPFGEKKDRHKNPFKTLTKPHLANKNVLKAPITVFKPKKDWHKNPFGEKKDPHKNPFKTLAKTKHSSNVLKPQLSSSNPAKHVPTKLKNTFVYVSQATGDADGATGGADGATGGADSSSTDSGSNVLASSDSSDEASSDSSDEVSSDSSFGVLETIFASVGAFALLVFAAMLKDDWKTEETAAGTETAAGPADDLETETFLEMERKLTF